MSALICNYPYESFEMTNFKRLLCFIFALTVMSLSTFSNANEYIDLDKRSFIKQWIKGKNNKVKLEDINTIVAQSYKQGFKHRIDPLLILGIIMVESRFKKTAYNQSDASGLMQVIPKWHKDKIAKRNIFAIDVNIEVGTTIFHNCLEKFKYNYNKAFRCYYGGNPAKYMNAVLKYKTSIEDYIIVSQFKYSSPIYLASANKQLEILLR